MASIKRTVVALVAGAAATLGWAAPAQAGLLVASAPDCGTPPAASQVFRPWLDLARYVPAPGGHAESPASWTLRGGATIVDGNEPWKVGGSGHGSALLLPAGSSATTGVMCVGIGHPTMRFFARRTSGLLSTLLVEVEFEGLGGALKRLPIGVVVAGSRWQPTLPFPVVANLLPLLPGQQTPVAFRFTPVLGGSWQIDDVYVDPWRSR